MTDVVRASGDQTPIANPFDVQRFLSGIKYPCSKEALVDTADQEGADQAIIRTLERLPLEMLTNPKEVTEWIEKE